MLHKLYKHNLRTVYCDGVKHVQIFIIFEVDKKNKKIKPVEYEINTHNNHIYICRTPAEVTNTLDKENILWLPTDIGKTHHTRKLYEIIKQVESYLDNDIDYFDKYDYVLKKKGEDNVINDFAEYKRKTCKTIHDLKKEQWLDKAEVNVLDYNYDINLGCIFNPMPTEDNPYSAYLEYEITDVMVPDVSYNRVRIIRYYITMLNSELRLYFNDISSVFDFIGSNCKGFNGEMIRNDETLFSGIRLDITGIIKSTIETIRFEEYWDEHKEEILGLLYDSSVM